MLLDYEAPTVTAAMSCIGFRRTPEKASMVDWLATLTDLSEVVELAELVDSQTLLVSDSLPDELV